MNEAKLMIPIIAEHAEEVKALCRVRGVLRLEIFGSAATGGYNPEHSDLDFLVEFQDLPAGNYADAFFGLMEDLEQLFHRPVDLVVASAIKNPYFLQSVDRTRQLLYAS